MRRAHGSRQAVRQSAMRWMPGLLAAWLLGAGAPPAAAREEFPLPPDAGELGPPAEMVLGAQPTRAHQDTASSRTASASLTRDTAPR